MILWIDNGEESSKRSLPIFRDRHLAAGNFVKFPSMDAVEQLILRRALRLTSGQQVSGAVLLGYPAPLEPQAGNQVNLRACSVDRLYLLNQYGHYYATPATNPSPFLKHTALLVW
jgi:hypothetical protein